MNSLFETTAIGNLELKNRFVRSATCEAMADEDGGVTPKLIDTFVALAEGDVEKIIEAARLALRIQLPALGSGGGKRSCGKG